MDMKQETVVSQATSTRYGAKIKFCGLTRECEIVQANELLVDYVGFVFEPKSKRYVNTERAKFLKSKLNPAIEAVGVFVDAEPSYIVDLYRAGIIDVVQLHGHEDESYIKRLRQMLDQVDRKNKQAFISCPRIFKAFSVHSEADVLAAQASSADLVLLDAGMGGTGRRFDWELVSRNTRSFILAGGLTPDNVVSALTVLHPFGVDVSSGIESAGVKDLEKMRAFVVNVLSMVSA